MEKMVPNQDYKYVDGLAHTLSHKDVCENYDWEPDWHTLHTRVHSDGWTITGCISEDYYAWVNEFEAHHPTYGTVKGDFEKEVWATSREGFQHFYQHHAPEIWDYADI